MCEGWYWVHLRFDVRRGLNNWSRKHCLLRYLADMHRSKPFVCFWLSWHSSAHRVHVHTPFLLQPRHSGQSSLHFHHLGVPLRTNVRLLYTLSWSIGTKHHQAVYLRKRAKTGFRAFISLSGSRLNTVTNSEEFCGKQNNQQPGTVHRIRSY